MTQKQLRHRIPHQKSMEMLVFISKESIKAEMMRSKTTKRFLYLSKVNKWIFSISLALKQIK
jgi:hypothetical protein